MSAKKAVVLFSGGLDSTTVLAIAQHQGYDCYALSFRYGQRHATELDAAIKIADAAQVSQHRIFDLDLTLFDSSALTNRHMAVPEVESEGIPVTYVPARNTIFLSIAMGWAEVISAQAIFLGVNAVDYSGYPDCRPEFVQAYQNMANLATQQAIQGSGIEIITPLINSTKAEIIRTGTALGVDYAQTISCYQATEAGLACGKCDSCRLRVAGFKQAGIKDPTLYI